MKKYIVLILLLIFTLTGAWAQLRLPQTSPQATVIQTIGLTDITVVYHSPGVKGREIWGKIVPYGQVWRSGANESTLITFSDSVKVEGKSVPAGTYSLFTLPESETQWFLILNKNTKLWGTDDYKAEEDLIRVPVTPQPTSFHENLQYSFNDIKPRSGKLYLSWDKLRIPVTIEVEVFNKALQYLQADLAQAKPDDWAIFAQASHYLVRHNTKHELALEWINKSLEIKENFYNSWVKAQLLAQKLEFEEAINLTKKAMKLGQNDSKNFPPLAPEMERALSEWKIKLHAQN